MSNNPRLIMNPEKIVMSLPGKNASDPDLPDVDKIFDSRWLFGNQILGKGYADDGNISTKTEYSETTSAFFDITIPDYGFKPAIILRQFGKYIAPPFDRFSPAKFYRNAEVEYGARNIDGPPRLIGNNVIRIARKRVKVGFDFTNRWETLSRIYWLALTP